MSLILPMLTNGGVSVVPVTITQTDATNNDSGATTYNHTGLSFGSAAADRIVVACVSGSASSTGRTVSSATIGGVTATEVVFTACSDARGVLGIYVASVPTGTSGTVSVTWSGSMARSNAIVYAMYGAGSGTAHDTVSNSSSPTSSGTIDIPADGGLIGFSYDQNNTSHTCTWTGVTEDIDAQLQSSGRNHSAGHADEMAGETGRTLQAAWTGGDTGLVGASWSP